ncbi:AraC-type DNA-binding protein [Chitinophaga sp. YR573]|nr:AraC-type DNA-binding protein [Chitinophaga sp. YR573]
MLITIWKINFGVMIKYQLPGNLVKNSIVADRLPHKYRQLRFFSDDVTIYCITGSWGTMIIQSGLLAGHYYSEQYLYPLVDMEITMIAETNLVCLHFVYQGAVHLTGSAGRIFLLEKKQAMHYFPAEQSFKTTIISGRPYHSIFIVPALNMLITLKDTYSPLGQLMDNLERKGEKHLVLPFERLKVTTKAEIRKIKKSQLTDAAGRLYYDSRVCDLVLAYLDSIGRPKGEKKAITAYSRRIDALINQINNFPEKDIIISEQASKMGISKRLLEIAFKEKCGINPKLYIQIQRIEKAKQLFDSGSKQVGEVCELVGYMDQSYFTRVFKKNTGKTPTEYLNNIASLDN